MPRSKRPLAEADPNAFTKPQEPAKSAKKVEKSNKRKTTEGHNSNVAKKSKSSTSTSNVYNQNTRSNKDKKTKKQIYGEQIDYGSKDNSKLQMFLEERGLSTTGTREEIIETLQNTSISYENLLSSELAEMMKRRHLKHTALGPKERKIARLRVNDRLAHNTGDSKSIQLYVKVSVVEEFLLEEIEKKREAELKNVYADYTQQRLKSHLTCRDLSTDGKPSELIARLTADDIKTANDRIKEFEERLTENVRALEESRGRLYEPGTAHWEMFVRDEMEEDRRLQEEAFADMPKRTPTCDYQCQDSKWADKTERELREMCRACGMQGWGTKATSIKWLETGEIEYEDESVTSLMIKCTHRGLNHRSHAKKDDLVKILRDADAAKN